MPLETANAKPSKEFFLEMFTRDISLEDCILDLIDNSIDSLIQTKNIDVSESMLLAAKNKVEDEDVSLIDLTINRKKIFIKDNCGGISLDKARNEAFRFGFKKSSDVGRLSVYGIGLKRAVFKLGTLIRITSRTLTDSFNMNFDVSEWAADKDNWTFPLEPKSIEQSSLEEPGTVIEISKLRTEVETLIRTGKIVSKLKNIIAETYGLFLEKYVRIILNGFVINPSEIPIGESSEVIPAKESFVKAFGSDQVRVTLLSSLASRDKKGKWSTESAGWYALCNGRVVVRADKTDLTGWGEPGVPLFHSKYRGFIGIAFFYSKNPHLLPWTTTKRGLNRESKVYQEAKNIMIGLSRPVLKFLDQMYPSDVKAQLDERSIAQKITQIDLDSINDKPLGAFKIQKPETKAIKTTVKVQYDAEEIDLNRIRKCLRRRNWSASKIGIYTFEHFLNKECPE